jgi:uncharacterized membrane protein
MDSRKANKRDDPPWEGAGRQRRPLMSFFTLNITRIPFFKFNFIMFLVCMAWVIILFAVPAVLPANSVNFGDDGVVGIRPLYEDTQTQIEEDVDNEFCKSIYNFGDSSCHLLENRTYFIKGNQMPLCARDVGIYVGFALGAIFLTFFMIELKIWWIIASLVPIGVDGLTQMYTAYESTNPVRLITGGLAGMMTTMVLGIMFYEMYMTHKYEKERKKAQGKK